MTLGTPITSGPRFCDNGYTRHGGHYLFTNNPWSTPNYIGVPTSAEHCAIMCVEAVNAINADRISNGQNPITPYENANGERAMSYSSTSCRCCNIYLHKDAGGTGYYYTINSRRRLQQQSDIDTCVAANGVGYCSCSAFAPSPPPSPPPPSPLPSLPPPPSVPPSNPIPPSIPNQMLELTGCPESHEVLTTLRLSISDDSLSQDQLIQQIRDSIHTNINANTAVSVPKHNIVVSTDVQSGIDRPPVPPRPPDLPPPPPLPPFPPPICHHDDGSGGSDQYDCGPLGIECCYCWQRTYANALVDCSPTRSRHVKYGGEENDCRGITETHDDAMFNNGNGGTVITFQIKYDTANRVSDITSGDYQDFSSIFTRETDYRFLWDLRRSLMGIRMVADGTSGSWDTVTACSFLDSSFSLSNDVFYLVVMVIPMTGTTNNGGWVSIYDTRDYSEVVTVVGTGTCYGNGWIQQTSSEHDKWGYYRYDNSQTYFNWRGVMKDWKVYDSIPSGIVSSSDVTSSHIQEWMSADLPPSGIHYFRSSCSYAYPPPPP